MIIITVSLFLSFVSITLANPMLKIHYINVGQADSILIQTPQGKVILIDAGNNNDYDTVATYLKKQGIKKLDVIIGTHPHEDHIGGLDGIIKNFQIVKVYLPNVSSNTVTFRDVLESIKQKGLKITQAKAGVNINIDPSIKVNILAPNNSFYESLNNYSAVIKISFGKTAFLFNGDAEDISENEMLIKGYNLKADILKISHHGSHSSTTNSFLKAVNPLYAIISVGKNNDYGHPHKETLDKLKMANVNIFRTDLSGTIIAFSDGNQISITTSKGSKSIISSPMITAGKNNNSQNINSESGYIGNENSKKFHLTSCPAAEQMSPSNKLLFKTRDEAIAAGYIPCKKCSLRINFIN